MTAVKDGDEWVLNGEKTFITGGNEADFVMVIAITDKELHKKTKGRDGVTCFIADREMGWKSEFIHTMGEWGPAGLVFDNVRVPEKNILGELHGGYKLGLEWIGFARWIVGARAVGAAERLLQMALDYAKERETFGKPIAERQAIQWQIADSAVEIEAAKWLALNAAFTLDQGKIIDTMHQWQNFMGLIWGTESLTAYYKFMGAWGIQESFRLRDGTARQDFGEYMMGQMKSNV